jgi:hypothetical protein
MHDRSGRGEGRRCAMGSLSTPLYLSPSTVGLGVHCGLEDRAPGAAINGHSGTHSRRGLG